MRSRFNFETPQQLRSFRLSTLAQNVYLEHKGIGFGCTPTMRKVAMRELNMTSHDVGISTDDLIEALRDAATKSIGHDPRYTEAPSKPYMPPRDDLDATT